MALSGFHSWQNCQYFTLRINCAGGNLPNRSFGGGGALNNWDGMASLDF